MTFVSRCAVARSGIFLRHTIVRRLDNFPVAVATSFHAIFFPPYGSRISFNVLEFADW